MKASLDYWRDQLRQAELLPSSRFAWVACYLLAIDLLLYFLRKFLALLGSSYAAGLSGWSSFLTFVVAALFAVLAFRWLKSRLLWRLRNRLIVTYVFIGVIPAVLLVAIGFITLYLFAGQFANFVVTSEIDSRLQSLSEVNAALAGELVQRIDHGEQPGPEFAERLGKADSSWQGRQLCAWQDGHLLPICADSHGSAPFSLLASPGIQGGLIVRDRGALYLRAVTTADAKAGKLTVISSEPLDQTLLERVAAGLGEITLFSWEVEDDTQDQEAQTTVSTPQESSTAKGPSQSSENSGYKSRSSFTVGLLPPPVNFLDHTIRFLTPLSVLNWSSGKEGTGSALQVKTRPSLLYARLFGSLGKFAKGVEYLLVLVLLIFAIIVMIALLIGVRLTRTITGAVAHLYRATTHVNRGDLSYRIPVKSSDQLAALATSFNSMSASLESLLQQQREKQKMENELVIAQEVQAQLFPKASSEIRSLEVHGFCRPASTVSGDYYDFLKVDPETLILALGDVSGKGISAALLMATIHSAVRAYSLEGIPLVREMIAAGTSAGSEIALSPRMPGAEVSPGTLLTLLNHQLYTSTPMEKYATLFLAFYDGRRRRFTYSNAGHLPPILLAEDGSLRRLDCGGTVVGLFDDRSYEEASAELKDGEIFLAYSDGVTEPENEFGEFGEERLIEVVRENRHLPLARISETVQAAVDDWIGDQDQPDDVTLVLARAR
jgi:phosphoserine phosphatase RsbU/P